MFKGLTKRERIILYILIVIVSVSVVFSFVIEPIFKNYKTQDNKINLFEVRLAKSKKLISGDEYSLNSYEKYLTNIQPKGTDEEEMANLLASIEEMAQASAVKITEIKPLPVHPEEFYKRFLVEVNAESQISQLTEFLYRIQKSPLLLKVSRLHLTADTRQQGLLKIQLAISRITIK